MISDIQSCVILVQMAVILLVLVRYHEKNKSLADATEPYRLEIERYERALASAWSEVTHCKERNSALHARVRVYEERERALMQQLADIELTRPPAPFEMPHSGTTLN